MSEVDWWRGEHGDEYTERNADADIEERAELWAEILSCLPREPNSVLEVGAAGGANLKAFMGFGHTSKTLAGVEPNQKARNALCLAGLLVLDGTATNPGLKADLTFTYGVLIHIPPDELLAACQGIYDAANRYIVCIEYFSADPEEKPYRGRKLWKRDFGGFWLDNFDLKPLGCGFAWKRMTGLDNLTYWIFAK